MGRFFSSHETDFSISRDEIFHLVRSFFYPMETYFLCNGKPYDLLDLSHYPLSDSIELHYILYLITLLVMEHNK